MSYKGKDGEIHDNERFQIAIFENDVVRLALKDRGEPKANYQLLHEIIYMEISKNHYEIMRQIINDGIRIAGEDYVFFTASTGQVRNSTITLLRKDFYDRHIGSLLMGLTPEYINLRGGMNIGKYLSYIALTLSSSILSEKEIDIDRCIVVQGLETIVTDKVKYLDIQQDDSGQCFVADTPKDYLTKDVPIEHTDGAGMFLPGELPSTCQIRGGYIKGAMFPFDFRQFAENIAKNTKITDAWGETVDIKDRDIRFIFTVSQLKTWKMYDSWDSYKQAFKQNGIRISINSYATPPKDRVNFAYQYLQTLPYGCDITDLCAPAKDDLRRICSDIDYVKEVMGYTTDVENDCTDSKHSANSIIAHALNIYPQLIHDTYITDKIKQLLRARRNSYRAGKLPLKGYYSYAAPDMYAFCEYLFCGENNPKGLVPKNHIYNKYYDDKGTVEHVICLRSPHLSRYEYGKRNLIKTEDCRHWFRYMEADTIMSCHDLLSKTLQSDWDGDEILVSDDAVLYKLAEDLPDVPLYYEMQQAEAQQITKEAIFNTLVKGFDNNVIGDSSNAITKLWNSTKAIPDNPTPYDDAINVFCAYSNYAIDYPKTGKSLDMGEYGALYDKLVSSQCGFNKPEIPPPNFFIEAKGKKRKNVAEPTANVMDRIKQFIGQGTSRFKYSYFDNADGAFDYRMLMNNTKRADGTPMYKVDRYNAKYQKLYFLLKARKSAKRSLCRNIEAEMKRRNTDSTERISNFDVFHYHCIREIREIFTNKQNFCNINLAVNYLIDLEYLQHEFVTSSKDILWKCFGHIILQNLQQNILNEICIKPRPRMAYVTAKQENKELDEMISERHSIDITQSDLDFIERSLKRHKNGNAYKNDESILYILYCLYKEAKLQNRLKDGYLIITKKKHIIDYGGGKQKPTRRNARFNMNTILKMAGAASYSGSLRRFGDTHGIEIIDDMTREQIKIKIDIPDNDDTKLLFEVHNTKNALVYLDAYKQDKLPCQCKVCGKDFVKRYNNQKTCSEKCSKLLHKINQARLNGERHFGAVS